MDPNPEIDKFAKAKIEQPNPDLRLRVTLLKLKGSRTDDLCYMKVFEEKGNAMKLLKAAASGETIVRKIHRIRNKELVKFIEKDFEGLKDIHVISEATIGVGGDAESNLFSHSFLDLLGTVNEVKLAEQLILENVLKTYSSLCFPVILMPTTICWEKMNIPFHKVYRVVGSYGNNLLKMEMESGAWIKIEEGASTGVWEWERVVNIFGPRENVNNAMSSIQSVISDQHGELTSVQALKELLNQFKEPNCVELIDLKNYSEKMKNQKFEQQPQTFIRIKKSEESKKQLDFKESNWSQTFGRIIPCRVESKQEKEEEEGKDPEYSGEPEKGKQHGI